MGTATIQGVLVLVIFRYLFGGAIAGVSFNLVRRGNSLGGASPELAHAS